MVIYLKKFSPTDAIYQKSIKIQPLLEANIQRTNLRTKSLSMFIKSNQYTYKQLFPVQDLSKLQSVMSVGARVRMPTTNEDSRI